ncbi:unnamed protein product [Notodromas monacha]|uniref:Mediator of RNA polymerase II transcription subunit 14 n=1 Tax=Notodromas monacha TaxID=399045 RepID=A0A7R9GD73_9CRUS|nr:unnamed protein product [Notodromas monacha]CAG0916624.1 unnamed protein product [Notodromas monacha]
MVPAPLEGLHTGPMANMPSQPPGQGSVSLPLLIEFIVQKTYHDLTVLVELLPQKSDMERKIAIVEFATRTRQLFVRLLALVKWAASACKVDKCASIMGFLDKQSHLFVDTADLLHRLSKETLVNARLPNFLIPAAVEVLTTGSYPRLPTCIRDNIIPPDPITADERKTTLSRLNQIIQHRLVTTTLPPQMSDFKIANGRVKLRVDCEFEVSLSLMGDGPEVPWRLLNVKILVEDKVSGGGKNLVHKMQVDFMYQVIQSRLMDHPKPLVELYVCLHVFCLGLQLEVLSVQTHALSRERLGDLIKIEDYQAGKSLSISYWRGMRGRETAPRRGFMLTIQVDDGEKGKPLSVIHTPVLSSDMSEMADKAIRSEDLSIERLLVHTIHVRTLGRLKKLQKEFALKVSPQTEPMLRGSPAVLSIPVLTPCLETEHLLISVDTYTGLYIAHVPQYSESKVTEEIQNCLNNRDKDKLDGLVSDLRLWIAAKHVEKSVQHLPAVCYERLPLLHRTDHEITKLERHKRYIRLHKHPWHLIVVELKDAGPVALGEVEVRLHVLTVKASSIEDNPLDDKFEAALPRSFLKVQTLVELNEFLCLHGLDVKEEYVGKAGRKRRRVSAPSGGYGPGFCSMSSPQDEDALVASTNAGFPPPPPAKRQKHVRLAPDVAHMVALVDDRLVYAALEHELTKRRVVHSGFRAETEFGNCLDVIWIPAPAVGLMKESPEDARKLDEDLKNVVKGLSSRLTSVRARVCCRPTKSWIVELVFKSSPVARFCLKDDGIRQVVHLIYDVQTSDLTHLTVDAFLREWAQIVRLYQLVVRFANDYKSNFVGLKELVKIKSYNYKRLVLLYGPGYRWMLTLQWNAMDEMYHMFFGAQSDLRNPHALMSPLITRWFNRDPDLAHLVKMLCETLNPLSSLAKLSTRPHVGQVITKPQAPLPVFLVVPESAFHLRVYYYSCYCLEIFIRGNGLVGIRDGAFSKFNWSKAVGDLTPIPMLKTFLNKFYDDAAVSSRSQKGVGAGIMFSGKSSMISAEDDNPPSPMAMTSGGSGFGHHYQHQQQMVKSSPFQQPMTPPVGGSNPQTPASPACSQMPPPGPSPAGGMAPASPFTSMNPTAASPMHGWPGSPNVGSKPPSQPPMWRLLMLMLGYNKINLNIRTDLTSRYAEASQIPVEKSRRTSHSSRRSSTDLNRPHSYSHEPERIHRHWNRFERPKRKQGEETAKNMVVVKNCCGCCDLRKGVLLVAILNLVIAGAICGYFINVLANYNNNDVYGNVKQTYDGIKSGLVPALNDWVEGFMGKDEAERGTLKNGVIVIVTICAIYVVISTVMAVGAYYAITGYYFYYRIGLLQVADEGQFIIQIALFCVVAGLMAYGWMAALSNFQTLLTTSKDKVTPVEEFQVGEYGDSQFTGFEQTKQPVKQLILAPSDHLHTFGNQYDDIPRSPLRVAD